MSALGLALAAAVCIGTSDFIYRSAARAADPARWMLIQSLAFAAVVAPIAVARGTTLGAGALYGLANGPINLLAFYCVLRALARGDALALAPVARLNFVVTAMLTVPILGEALTSRRALGLSLAVAAVLLVGRHYARVAEDRGALVYALAAMLASGLAGLLFKLGLAAGASPLTLVSAQGAGFVLSAACAVALGRRDGACAPLPAALACGVLVAGFYLALTEAFTMADAVVVAPIAQLGFVLTAILSVWLLGERLTASRLAALGLAVGAVASLAGA